MKIAIVGASGYTGIELLRVLQLYPDIEINQIVSRQFTGKKLQEVFPNFSSSKLKDLIFSEETDIEASDFYFLCLPHEPSVELVKKLLEKNKKVIDLSAAYRIKNPAAYPEYYGFEHKYPDILLKAAYGLPEIYREQIREADIVANPGCYPTATLLALYPAVKEKVITENNVVVNALSGISGAGRSLKQQFHYPEAFGNAYAYSPIKHRHIPEMEDILKNVYGESITVRFTPHILPVSRGMISTVIYKTNLSKQQLIELYRLEYRYEPFIRFCDTPPQIKNVVGSNYCDIYVDKDERTGQAVVITAIDNLGKGASTQAVQNFNLMTDRDEEYILKNLSDTSILFP
ncbi:N-acetyl-gamma-glutamyl-phosphate reductase [Persephonella sp. KM09-Lau-8]|uniref:N-acetyl-gamma-glutamyl-phosphate reductase n=1 Tax=Persephonella sp. KM09-Lau-8 TaxID=1158345 RepID=UPI0004982599|nr:N-acetyl-gamma-glutamyl-phosphate reductase [Persephonella sp. KM09-Lau-8]